MKKILQTVFKVFFRMVPEGISKKILRKILLLFRGYLPKELQINLGDVVVLVGTPNISTIARSRIIIGNNGRLIVIEADEFSVSKLREWKSKNKENNNIEIIYKAVWSEKKELELLKARRPGDNRIKNDKIMTDNDIREQKESGGYTNKIMVSADTINNIMKNIGIDHIDHMEITINGAEFEALKGARTVLHNTQRIFVKGHSRDVETNEPINLLIDKFLTEIGFTTILTKATQSVAGEWGDRDGDIFAYREDS